MDIGAILLLLALLILIALFVARPFMVRAPAAWLEEAHVASVLLADRDRILNTLQELDFDFSLGKIPAEDYPVQRTKLLQRGATVLRQMDALTPNPSPASGRGETTEDRLEAAIAARRGDAAVKSAAEAAFTDEDLEAIIAKRRVSLKDKAAGFCPKCGYPILISDSFCPQCGYTLK